MNKCKGTRLHDDYEWIYLRRERAFITTPQRTVTFARNCACANTLLRSITSREEIRTVLSGRYCVCIRSKDILTSVHFTRGSRQVTKAQYEQVEGSKKTFLSSPRRIIRVKIAPLKPKRTIGPLVMGGSPALLFARQR